MQAKLVFNPEDYSEKICRFILIQAEAWKCSPGEALSRILDTLAAKSGFTAAKPEAAK